MAQTIPTARLLIESRMADALRGDPGACFDLGTALTSGICTREDLVEAHKWFTLAAQAGYGPAVRSSAQIARRLSATELASARRRTRAAQSPIVRQAAQFSARLFA